MIKKFFGRFESFTNKHSNAILTLISVGGTAYAVYRAIKDAPKCKELLDELNENGASTAEKAWAITKTLGPTFGAAAMSMTASVANYRNTSTTISQLSSAYALAKTVNTELLNQNKNMEEDHRLYSEKVKEEVGEEKEREIRDKVAKDRPLPEGVYTLPSKPGEFLVIEPTQHRPRTVTETKLDLLKQQIKNSLITWDRCEMGNVYEYLSLPDTTISGEYGWKTSPSKGRSGCCEVDIRLIPKDDYDSDRATIFEMQYEPAPYYIG